MIAGNAHAYSNKSQLQGYDGVVVDVVDNLLYAPQPNLNVTVGK